MSHRILLVDDEDDILEFVRYNLQREGYEVFTARDGAEGVARALEVHPHLILLDRMMPRMDGLETCRRLREEIYSRVWGEDVVVGDRTIDVHIRKLRQKIGDEHIITVKGVGYKYEK